MRSLGSLKRLASLSGSFAKTSTFRPMAVSFSRFYAELRFTKEHEWISINGEEGTIGISDHAQKELGDVVHIDLPDSGASFKAGQEFGSVESVKSSSPLYSPVTGKVTAVNSKLSGSPETVNQSPLKDGWMIKLKLSNLAETKALMTEADYVKFLESLKH
eukprot:TRINITY_DN1361_c0_g1_i1.p1 TRINITY_DN1361_c0_g1~~TRINITY_DN1361_c0_g1_i1.p1  ORF type:complete len:167 (-),score=28.75 TRINITY_DN1361_c0_g1_i1:27-506(-)